MCSMYWNLVAEVTCPCCGWQGQNNLQTHLKGEVGACLDYFNLGEPVEYLEGLTGTMTGEGSDFIAVCPKCQTFWCLDARIEDGRVVEVWNLPDTDCEDAQSK